MHPYERNKIRITLTDSILCFLHNSKATIVALAPLEAVLFDVDGTLCDSDPIHHIAFQEMLQEVTFTSTFFSLHKPHYNTFILINVSWYQIGFNGGVPIDEDFFIKNIAGKHNDDIAAVLFPDDIQRGLKFCEDKEAYFRK